MPYDPNRDPFAYFQGGMLNFARRVIPVTPGPDDFQIYPRALSIWVPEAISNASIVVTPSRNADDDQLTVELARGRTVLDWCQIRRVISVSGGAGIVVRGLYDT